MMYKGYIFNKKYDESIQFIGPKKRAYLEAYVALDTETSWNHDDANPMCWIYQWAFTFNDGLYYGRNPLDLCNNLKSISAFYNSDVNKRIRVFVHNLPYDFSYLWAFFENQFGKHEKILATTPHKVFNVLYPNGLEFMCTYKLANNSLARWGNKLNVRHKKLVGEIAYNIIRYQDSPLYRNDWRYMFYDVITLDECIKQQLAIYNDTIASIPLTSTGYVRREILRAYKGNGKHKFTSSDRKKFIDTRMNKDVYIACRDEFSGGITHVNRYYSGKTIKGTIRHRDFRSHYPSQQRIRKFPMSKFVLFTNETNVVFLKRFSTEYAILCNVILQDVNLSDKKITLPYLQTSHVLRKHSSGFKYLDDNGRIIAFKGTSILWVDFHELLLILRQYNCKYKIVKTYASRLGYLPNFITDTIDKHYKAKSDLKSKEKELKKNHASESDIFNAHIDLLKSKNILNGIYGVSATDPVRIDIDITSDGDWKTTKHSVDDIDKILNEFYKNPNSFMRYAWGCYTTIYARLELLKFIELIGYNNYIYCDTDSIFYISNDEIEKKIVAENEKMYNHAIGRGAYITTDNGNIITYDAFDDENENISEFKALHSKCYAYIANGVMHSTIAGVTRIGKNGKSQENELKSLSNLSDGFTFTECGGTKSAYINTGCIIEYNNQVTCGGCIITDTTKTLSELDFTKREEIFFSEY